MRIGGVVIDAAVGVLAHSDGDVLLHAVTDALLGALALGDIGVLFPDTDAENRDRDSAEFVAVALRRVHRLGWTPINVDCTILLQRPKLGPLKEQIRSRLADLLKLPTESVSIKAKSGEQVGPVGRGESIEAQAAVLLQRVANETE